MKHAELQRHIMQQQEELRRVSEQLLIGQCGVIQSESPILLPPSSSQSHSHHLQTQHSESSGSVQIHQVLNIDSIESNTYKNYKLTLF